MVNDIRAALEELHSSAVVNDFNDVANGIAHAFLVLDKSLQAFPWESIPCLRGRSVSRIPSLAFLRDRIDLAASLSKSLSPSHEIILDSTKTSYVLNPGGDLLKTQSSFQPWLGAMERDFGWNGVIGRAPLEEEVKAALLHQDLFMYVFVISWSSFRH